MFSGVRAPIQIGEELAGAVGVLAAVIFKQV